MSKGFKKERIKSDYYNKMKVKCQCGHILVIPAYVDEIICSWCGHKVKNNTEAYFMYKMRKLGGENEKNKKDI